MSIRLSAVYCAISVCVSSMSAHAVPMHVSPDMAGSGGYNDGYASKIFYDASADRGTSNGRDNPENALGQEDESFFEIGLGSFVDLQFGASFDTTVTVFEITFGNVLNWPEQVTLQVGNRSNGVFTQIGNSFTINNEDAQEDEGGAEVAIGSGLFDTVRLIDTTGNLRTPSRGGFDIDAVKVTADLSTIAAVPLPATGLLLLAALGAGAFAGRRKTKV